MKPTLTDASFPKLSMNPNTENWGTVTGPNLDGHGVRITGKNSKLWKGTVTGPAGPANVWKAMVKRQVHDADKNDERGIEQISVTVTNPATSEESDKVDRDADVVP